MAISDEIPDFWGKANFKYLSSPEAKWRIGPTRAYFPVGFYGARIGPKGADNPQSAKFGIILGGFLLISYPITCFLVFEYE